MALYRLYRKEWERRGGFKEPLKGQFIPSMKVWCDEFTVDPLRYVAISQSSPPPTERLAAKEKQATSSAVSKKAATHSGSNVASTSSAINNSRIRKANNVKVSKKRKGSVRAFL